MLPVPCDRWWLGSMAAAPIGAALMSSGTLAPLLFYAGAARFGVAALWVRSVFAACTRLACVCVLNC
jgi:hypothetical protein